METYGRNRTSLSIKVIDNRVRGLFEDLRRLRFDTDGFRPEPVNLGDVLEVIAVAVGLKPAHLNGQAFRSAMLFNDLEHLAARYDFVTLRTKSVRHHYPRMPRYDQAIYRCLNDEREQARQAVPDVLWVYSDPSLGGIILDTVAGDRDVSKVLGYPECCVRSDAEYGTCYSELYIEALGRTHRAKNVEDYIRLLDEDPEVPVDLSRLDNTTGESNKTFPYVQFNACRACINSHGSPAAKINRSMRDLAFSLSEIFGREIWEAQYKIYAPGIKLGRNNLCPCGSRKKFKKCCGRY